MKKILLILLALVMCISFSSCCCVRLFTDEKKAELNDFDINEDDESKGSIMIGIPDNSDEDETSKDPEPVDPFESINALIDEGRYEEAYSALSDMGGEEAEKLLENFVWHYTEEVFSDHLSSFRYEYVYNENALLTNELCYYNYYSAPDETIYYYDEDGRVIKEAFIANNGGDDYNYDYTYDEKGNLISEVHQYLGTYIVIENSYNPKGNLVYKTTKADYDGYLSNYSQKYVYDSQNRLVEEGYVENGVYKKSTVYSYDERGNLLKEDSLENFTYEYTYDENNRVTTMTYNNFHYGENEITKYTYDADGKLINETFSSYYEIITVTYSYDEYGNLLETVRNSSSYGSSVTEYKNYVCFYIEK